MDVTVSQEIARAPDHVAAYASHPLNDTKWIGGIREVRLLTDGPLREGSRVERVATFAGRRVEYVLEVARFEPGRLLDMPSVKAPFPMHVTYAFEPTHSGTLMKIRIRGGPEGLLAVLAPLMAIGVRRNVAGDLRRLKAILETNGGG